ncbi:MAG TPA: hypothetical protein VGX00_08280 [Thermoplasmata archaeon]|nr:hypothetical protein [Thermoplasmata archaeon]
MGTTKRDPAHRTSPKDLTHDLELDALESLGEAFEEACEHVGRDPDFRSVRIGPVRRLPLGELWPGEFGWSRTLESGPPPVEGEVLLFLVPGSKAREEVVSAPVPKIPQSGFALVEVVSGPPWRLVAARSGGPRSRRIVTEFARAVARELRSE